MNAENILSRVEKITNSDESIPLDESFEVNFGIQKNDAVMSGTTNYGWQNLDAADKANDTFRRKCVVQMKNTDNLCVARSLCVLKAKEEKDPGYKTLIHGASVDSMGVNGLKRRALDLQRAAGFGDDQAITFQDLPKFEAVLDAQIMVIDGGKAFYYAYMGAVEKPKKYYLLKTENHCHPIVNMKAFFNKGRFCMECNTAYYPNVQHK